MTFDEAVQQLTEEDGVSAMFTIPGIWECLSEHYNNDAIALMENDNEPESEEDQEEDQEDCEDCGGSHDPGRMRLAHPEEISGMPVNPDGSTG